jgi:probable rRNA maturation factor
MAVGRQRGSFHSVEGDVLEVVLLNRQRRRPINRRRILRVLRGAASALGVGGDLSLVLTGDRALRRLNGRYRQQDKATDVLSFSGGEAGLGDIVISVETAERNARASGRTLPEELDVLALHGFLHVLGYDHETDDGTMGKLERLLRRKLLGTKGSTL